MVLLRTLPRAAALLAAVAVGCQATHDNGDGSGSAHDATGGDQGADAGFEGPPVPPGLFAAYDFDQSAGTVAIDSSGNFNNAGLIGQVDWGTAGHSAGDVTFTGGYLLIPPGSLDQARAFSFAAWVKLRTDRIWQRVFDFGSGGTNQYMFLTPHSDQGTFRFAISRNGAQFEQILESPTPLPIGVWKHVAVVLTGASGTLYLDGQSVATGTDVTFRPVDIAPLANQWLGRSEFTSDPSLDGEIDEVRIYDRPLSAAEVRALFGP